MAAMNADHASPNHDGMNAGVGHSQGSTMAPMGMGAMEPGQTPSPKLEFKNFDRDQAYQYSQAVIGKTVSNYRFTDVSGNTVELRDFAGQPLLISLIYTSCYHICPTTTQYLGKVTRMARQAMPNKDFTVLTIGFDTFNDTPEAMREFAKKQGGIGEANWHFLSTDQKTIDALSRELGFIFYPSPQGFNHLVQTTILKSDREIYRQVYGMKFDVQLLIEPLKELLFNRPSTSLVGALSDKIRFFCTVYDASGDRYRFDYSIFIGVFVGFMSCLVLGLQLIKEWRRSIKLT
ncbi:MAG: SCO family protein [Pseudomonadales bacterium]|nr:SCO family protein [Pseudomonadales bacterium]